MAEDRDFENYLKKIESIRDYSSEQFDKQIVYLAGGGLVFTVGFVKNIVEITELTDVRLLIATWVLFTSSLIFNLVSHKTSIYSMDTEINSNHNKSDCWNSITEFLNVSSIISLLSAIIVFIIFVSSNI